MDDKILLQIEELNKQTENKSCEEIHIFDEIEDDKA